MKTAVFGDIHGNLEALEAVLEDMQIQSIVRTVCTGDVVGEFANPRECLAIVQALGAVMVKGDWDEKAATGRISSQLTDEERDYFRALPLERTLDSFTVVHASLNQPESWREIFSGDDAESSFRNQKTDLCFCGHTQLPQVFIRDTEVHNFGYKFFDVKPGIKYLINVGSVGEPRDGDWRASYAIYDSVAKKVTLRRLPFDLEKARWKRNR
jgi:predicted phosphodiesterase